MRASLRESIVAFTLLVGVFVAVCLAPAQAQQGQPGRVNVASATSTTSNLIRVTANILGLSYRATGTAGSIRVNDGNGVERIVVYTPASAAGSGYIAFPGEGVFMPSGTNVTLTNVDGITVLYR